MKNYRNRKGFTLVETLAALAVLVFLVVGMGTGINAAGRSYNDSVFESDSATLSGILNSAMGDILRYADDVRGPEKGALYVSEDGANFLDSSGALVDQDFVFTSYDYGIRDAYFELSSYGSESEGVLELRNLRNSTITQLVNTGAYPDLGVRKVDGKPIADYAWPGINGEGGYFNINYEIYSLSDSSKTRTVNTIVRLVNVSAIEASRENSGKEDGETSLVRSGYLDYCDGSARTGFTTDAQGYITLPNKLRSGYTLKGWYTSKSFSAADYVGVPDDSVKIDKANTVLYAQWEKGAAEEVKSFIITYDYNDGTGTQTSQSVPVNNTGVVLQSASRAGYSFGGWYTDNRRVGNSDFLYGTPTGSGSYTTTVSNDVTLYAYWIPNTYYIQLLCTEDNGSETDLGNYTVKYDETFIIPRNTYSKGDEYSFFGWTDEEGNLYDDGGEVKNLTAVDGATAKLYARYSGFIYQISFNANAPSGTTSTGSMNTQTCTYGMDGKLNANAYAITGYDFAGWSTTPGGSILVTDQADLNDTNLLAAARNSTATTDFGGTEIKAITLYAKWNIHVGHLTIHYTDMKGTQLTTDYTANVNYGAAYSVNSPDALEGYIIDDTAQSTISGTMGLEDVEVTVKYSQRQLTLYVKFVNGEPGSTVAVPGNYSLQVGYGESYKVTAPNVTGYEPDQAVVEGTMPARDLTVTITYTAVSKRVTVNYVYADGTTAADSVVQAVKYDATYKITSPTIIGYTPDKGEVTGTMGLNDVTATVTYSGNKHTVTFDPNGGTCGTKTKEVTFGKEYGTLPTATRTGYTYGWYTMKTGGELVTASTKVNNDKDHTLYAQWTPVQYTVKFEGNGADGGSMSDQTFAYGAAQNLTANAYTRTGYTFAGWKGQDGKTYTNGQSVNNLLSAPGTFTMTAQWTANTYTIAYEKNNESATGTVESQTGCTYDKNVTLQQNGFTLTGYTFVEWNTKSDGTGTGYAANSQQKNLSSENGGTVTLYAKWAANSYTIVFKENGGTGTVPEPLVCKYDADVTFPYASGLSREGYTFNYWSTEQKGADKDSHQYKQGKTYEKLNLATEGEVPVYARWKANKYTVVFEKGNDNATGSMADETFTYNAEKKELTANAYKLTGYTFKEWKGQNGKTYADKEAVKNLTAEKDGKFTMTAQWTPITYTVNFAAGEGGSGTMAAQTFTYDTAQNLTPNSFTRTGYHFKEWSGIGGPYGDKASVTNLANTQGAEVTLTATWEIDTYTVKFDTQVEGITVPNATADYNTKLTKPSPDPERTGYTFGGWYKDAACTKAWDFSNDTVKADTTLYAKWTANNYQVVFEKGNNNATGSMSNESFVYDAAEKALTANAYKLTGYTFDGWKGQNNQTYDDKEAVKNLTAEKDGKFTMTAQWAPITYKVNFAAGEGGSGTMAAQTFTYDTAQNLTPNSFTRTGYHFKEWSGTGGPYGDKASVTNLASTQDAEVTLTATWEIDTYTVTFNTQVEGITVTNGSAQYNKTVTRPADPQRTGYNFGGWYKDDACTNAWDFSNDTVKADTTLYAKWTANKYTVIFDANGGSVAESSKEVTYGNTYGTFPTPNERYGYRFDGWFTDATGGDEVKASDTVQITANQTLYAHWTDIRLDITYELVDNGEKVSGPDEAVAGETVKFTPGTSNNDGLAKLYVYKTGDKNTKVIEYSELEKNKEYSFTMPDYPVTIWIEGYDGECIIAGTLITLADGISIPVEELKGEEELQVWNHETGKLEKSKIAYIVNHSNGEDQETNVTYLTFSDKTKIGIVGEHVFYDLTLNKYVAITKEDAETFIGHKFAGSVGKDGKFEIITLKTVEQKTEMTQIFEVLTYNELTCFTNGILSGSAYIDPILNIFDIDPDTMAYDQVKMKQDIQKYGLYTYDDFKEYVSEDMYNMHHGALLKIPVEKGYTTWEELMDLIALYYSVQ